MHIITKVRLYHMRMASTITRQTLVRWRNIFNRTSRLMFLFTIYLRLPI
jgi:hypothetical protein